MFLLHQTLTEAGYNLRILAKIIPHFARYKQKNQVSTSFTALRFKFSENLVFLLLKKVGYK